METPKFLPMKTFSTKVTEKSSISKATEKVNKLNTLLFKYQKSLRLNMDYINQRSQNFSLRNAQNIKFKSLSPPRE